MSSFGPAVAGCVALALAGCMEDEPRFGTKEFPRRASQAQPGRFDESAIRAYSFFNEPYGERREIHFVATGPRATHETQARECVEHHLDEEDVAAPFCYAYPSERAFEAARFTRSNGQTFKNCWSARAQKPIDDDAVESYVPDPDSTVGEEGCPDIQRR